jgi:hypothetical protein
MKKVLCCWLYIFSFCDMKGLKKPLCFCIEKQQSNGPFDLHKVITFIEQIELFLLD